MAEPASTDVSPSTPDPLEDWYRNQLATMEEQAGKLRNTLDGTLGRTPALQELLQEHGYRAPPQRQAHKGFGQRYLDFIQDVGETRQLLIGVEFLKENGALTFSQGLAVEGMRSAFDAHFGPQLEQLQSALDELSRYGLIGAEDAKTCHAHVLRMTHPPEEAAGVNIDALRAYREAEIIDIPQARQKAPGPTGVIEGDDAFNARYVPYMGALQRNAVAIDQLIRRLPARLSAMASKRPLSWPIYEETVKSERLEMAEEAGVLSFELDHYAQLFSAFAQEGLLPPELAYAAAGLRERHAALGFDSWVGGLHQAELLKEWEAAKLRGDYLGAAGRDTILHNLKDPAWRKTNLHLQAGDDTAPPSPDAPAGNAAQLLEAARRKLGTVSAGSWALINQIPGELMERMQRAETAMAPTDKPIDIALFPRLKEFVVSLAATKMRCNVLKHLAGENGVLAALQPQIEEITASLGAIGLPEVLEACGRAGLRAKDIEQLRQTYEAQLHMREEALREARLLPREPWPLDPGGRGDTGGAGRLPGR